MNTAWRWVGAVVAAMALSACGSSGGTDKVGDVTPPPSSAPPANDPPTTNPPTTNPPVTQPPVTNPPVTNPPVTNLPPEPIEFPTIAGWTFYGPQHGGPAYIYDVTTDADGNIWVAGGEEGLFLLRPDAERFERFTLEDGLRPYGYLPDGSDAARPPSGDDPGTAYLKVIAVEGGPEKGERSGVVFVGYAGKPGPRGEDDCENNWDYHTSDPSHVADPSIYKSGDADRVELKPDGTLHVVHYDIFSGPTRVGNEPEGRERLCHVYRLAYDSGTESIWFAANHGIARGVADYEHKQACFPHGPYDPMRPNDRMYSNWDYTKCGVDEHAHPIVATPDGRDLLAGTWNGVSVDPLSGDVWFGGTDLSTKFRYATHDRDWWGASEDTEYNSDWQFDIWPGGTDGVSDMVADESGGVWVASLARGLAYLGPDGQRLATFSGSDGLITAKDGVSVQLRSVARDAAGTVWAGYAFLGAIALIDGASVTHLFGETFGMRIASTLPVARIVRDGERMIVGFGYPDGQQPGAALGIYRRP